MDTQIFAEIGTLTPRELELVQLASVGKTDKVIASTLGISVGTVGTYWSRIRLKLGVNTRTEAVARFIAYSSSSAPNDTKAGDSTMQVALIEALANAIACVDVNLNIWASNESFRELFPHLETATGSSLRHPSVPIQLVAALNMAVAKVVTNKAPTRLLFEFESGGSRREQADIVLRPMSLPDDRPQAVALIIKRTNKVPEVMNVPQYVSEERSVNGIKLDWAGLL